MKWLTLVIFGLLSMAAGMLTLLLPETKGRVMPENLDDAVVLQFEKDTNRVHTEHSTQNTTKL